MHIKNNKNMEKENSTLDEVIKNYAYLTARIELAKKYRRYDEEKEMRNLRREVEKTIKNSQLTLKQKIFFASVYNDYVYMSGHDPYEQKLYEEIKNADDNLESLWILLAIYTGNNITNFWHYLLEDNSIPIEFLKRLHKSLHSNPQWDENYFLEKEIERREKGEARVYFFDGGDY
jgi:hypothetical protein